jgi:DNA-binding transcriptional LysR family regulator
VHSAVEEFLAAALKGVGLVWINEWDVAPHFAHGCLVRALEDWSPQYPGLCLYYPGHRHVPAGLRAFIEVVREAGVKGGWRR